MMFRKSYERMRSTERRLKDLGMGTSLRVWIMRDIDPFTRYNHCPGEYPSGFLERSKKKAISEAYEWLSRYRVVD